MPVTIPDQDPADLDYYRPLSMGRVVLLANSDVPWSVDLTRRYARKKRIPLENIVSAPQGTALGGYDPGTDLGHYTNVIEPVADRAAAVDAQAILQGPGTPDGVILRNRWTGAGFTPSAGRNVSSVRMLGAARWIKHIVDTVGIGDVGYELAGAQGAFAGIKKEAAEAYPPAFQYFGHNHPPRRLLPAVTPVNLLDYYIQYQGITWPVFVPKPLLIDLLHEQAAGVRQLPCGKIGISVGPDAFNGTAFPTARLGESRERSAAVVEKALRYGQAMSPANRYRHPVHFQFETNCPGDFPSFWYVDLAFYAAKMPGWGYERVTYAQRNALPNATMDPWVPQSGSAYNKADLDAGRVQNYPYHTMFGHGSNTECWQSPWSTAWKPTAGGGSSIGPSLGWGYVMDGFAAGGSAGMGNGQHITTVSYNVQPGVFRALLAGYSWAEALFFEYRNDSGDLYPIGDPLARPFPR